MADAIIYRLLDTSIGTLRLVATGTALLGIEFPHQHKTTGTRGRNPVLDATASQLREYFQGTRRTFDLPMAPQGTRFQQQVWARLLDIPYGELRSYAEIAAGIGNPRAVRAVGAANARNPLPVVVPCHRVIGSSGQLTGFAGGLEAKRRLLALEGCERALKR